MTQVLQFHLSQKGVTMSAEKRGSNRLYYYRSVRSENRVRKEYVGPMSSPAVELVQRADRLKAAVQTASRKFVRCEADVFGRQNLAFTTLGQIIGCWRSLSRSPQSLVYRKPDRIPSDPQVLTETRQTVDQIMQKRLTESEYLELAERADNGDTEAYEQLRHAARYDQELLDLGGDLVAVVRQFTVESLAGDCARTRALVEGQIDSVVAVVQRDQVDDPLEKMLIDVMTVSWLTTMKAHGLASRSTQAGKAGEFWETAARKGGRQFQ